MVVNTVVSRDQLKILLETVVGELSKIVTHFKVQTRIEHDNLSTRAYFSIRRKSTPGKEVVKMNIEFMSVLNTKQIASLHLDTHIYFLTEDLTDAELKDVILLHAMIGIVPYELANRP